MTGRASCWPQATCLTRPWPAFLDAGSSEFRAASLSTGSLAPWTLQPPVRSNESLRQRFLGSLPGDRPNRFRCSVSDNPGCLSRLPRCSWSATGRSCGFAWHRSPSRPFQSRLLLGQRPLHSSCQRRRGSCFSAQLDRSLCLELLLLLRLGQHLPS